MTGYAQAVDSGRTASSENRPPEDNPHDPGNALYYAWMAGYAQGQVHTWNANALAFMQKTLELAGGAVPQSTGDTGDLLERLQLSELLTVFNAEYSRIEAVAMSVPGTDVRRSGTYSMLMSMAQKAYTSNDPQVIREAICRMRKH